MKESVKPIIAITSLIILISATLLFWCQPLFTKQVLPILGGSPNVWNISMVCFQGLLLAGYFYADKLTRIKSGKLQASIHALTIISSLCFLFLVSNKIDNIESAHQQPVTWLIRILLIKVGAIFFVMATTSTLMQKWLTNLNNESDVYWLYIVSNAGSVLGVFGFICLVEPFAGLSEQLILFKLAYTLFAIIGISICFSYFRNSKATEENKPTVKIDKKDKIRWLVLAAIPSSLLLSVTTHITTDIAPVPLVWMLILGLYLLSFMIAFSSWKNLHLKSLLKLQATICIPLIADFFLNMTSSGGISIMLWHLMAFFITSIICHRLIYQSKPSPESLTTFYLYISIGGVLGGIFNSLIAPVIFKSLIEYPLAIVLAFAMRPAQESIFKTWKKDILIGAALLCVLVVCLLIMRPILNPYKNPAGGILMMIGFFALKFCFDQEAKPLRLASCFAATVIAGLLLSDLRGKIVEQYRNFYGIITIDGSNKDALSMRHGTTIHGMEYLSKDKKLTPLTYYHPTGPLGILLSQFTANKNNLQVAAVGLGVGSVACYGRIGDAYTFYEINPAVIKIASDEKYFSFLSKCPPKSKIIEGDARISLSEATHKFDLIILDAFTSDAVLVHLITKEAFDIYWNKINQEGAIIIHISNRYLNLAPVLKAIADDHNLDLKILQDNNKSQDEYKQASTWAIMGNQADIDKLNLPEEMLIESKSSKNNLWTDNYSNILRILNF